MGQIPAHALIVTNGTISRVTFVILLPLLFDGTLRLENGLGAADLQLGACEWTLVSRVLTTLLRT